MARFVPSTRPSKSLGEYACRENRTISIREFATNYRAPNYTITAAPVRVCVCVCVWDTTSAGDNGAEFFDRDFFVTRVYEGVFLFTSISKLDDG